VASAPRESARLAESVDAVVSHRRDELEEVAEVAADRFADT
jgi:hypothetical protein